MASKGNILVIDDDPDIVRKSAKILRGTGYKVEPFRDDGHGYKELKQLLEEMPFSVIVTDGNLFNTTGMDIAKLIRRGDGINQNTPIIMQTSDITEAWKLKAKDAGIETVIDKSEFGINPPTESNLLRAVGAAIAEKEKSGRKLA